MKITIDTNEKTLTVIGDEAETKSLYSDEAFEILSDLWVKVGWNQKHSYTFSWLGRPIIQLPEDVLRTQEMIFNLKPTVIIETGVAHGGSLIFYASLFRAMNLPSRVVGIDIEIRPHNRHAIESHFLSEYITLIEGSSVDAEIVVKAKRHVGPGDTVLVILDSNHTYSHVLAELEAYHDIVSVGSYIVATDGSMGQFADTPRGTPEWLTDNPERAAQDFVASHPDFVIEQPAWTFNESTLRNNITHWPSAWVKRKANV